MSIIKSSRDPRLIIVKKTVTQTINNSAALTDDNGLTTSLAADSAYEWQMIIHYISTATADMRLNVVVPGSDVTLYYIDAQSNVRTYGTNYFISGAATAQIWWHRGITRLVGAGGTFKLQWAQQVAEASDSTIYAGSCLILHRLW